MTTRRNKICASCGREFAWRRKWADHWNEVRYCSERCRRRRVTETDQQLEHAIVKLLSRRDSTICPAEAAREACTDNWRAQMADVRRAGRRLAAAGRVIVLQRGRQVDPSTARGAIRYGRGPAFSSDSLVG